MDIVTSEMLKRALPLFTAFAIVVLVLAVSTILYFGQDIFIPFALGILLSFMLAPIVNGLQRLRVPRVLAVGAAVFAALVVILALGFVITSQLASLAAQIPTYRGTLNQKLEGIVAATESEASGPLGRAVTTLQEIAADVEELVAETEDAGPADQPVVVQVEESGNAFEIAASIISPLLGPFATIGIVIVFAIFILLQREDLRNRLIRLAGTSDLQQTTAAIDDTARRLGRLLLFQLGVNAAFGVIVSVGLMVIGVPSPFLWGVLGGILRYIPYVGGFISAALPMALAFAVDPGWSMVIWTAVLFIGAEAFLSNFVEPVLYGHSTGLSPVAILLAALVWAFLWGPVGLVLATPLTICLVVMGRYVPRLEFIDVMFGDRPALSPPQIFYQRMLADAPEEAADQARAFLRGRALATYYDEVALEGLRLAHDDVSRFAVEGSRLEVLRAAALRLVALLDRVRSPLPKGGVLNAEAAAAVAAAGPDAEVARIVKRGDELAAEWGTAAPVVCVAGTSTLDEPVTAMLAQVVTKHGLRARLVRWEELAARQPTKEEAEGVALVVLSFLEPLSVLHLRHAVRQAHRIVPEARVVIGIWRARDPAMISELQRKVHADAVVTTFNSALAAILDLASAEPRESTRPARPDRDRGPAAKGRRQAVA